MAKNKSEKIIIQVQVKDSGVSAKIDKVTKAKKDLSQAEKINLKLTRQLNAEKEREATLNNKNYVALQKAKIANMNLAKEKKNLALQTETVTTATIKGKTQTGLNNAILTEAGRTASDAAYGMQGMANNLGQLLTLTSQHVQTKGGFGASMRELGKSLFGIGGILIGLQLLISYLPKIQKMFKEWSANNQMVADTMETAAEGMGDTIGSFELYLATLKNTTKGEEEHQDAIDKLNEKFPDFIKNLDEAGVSINDIKNNTKGATTAEDLYRESIMKSAMAKAAAGKIEEKAEKMLQARIDAEMVAKEQGFESVEQMKKEVAQYEALSRAEKKRMGVAKVKFTEGKNALEDLKETNKETKKNIDLLLEYTDIEGDREKLPKVKPIFVEQMGINAEAMNTMAKMELDASMNTQKLAVGTTKILNAEEMKRLNWKKITTGQQMMLVSKGLNFAAKGFKKGSAMAKAAAVANAIEKTHEGANNAFASLSPIPYIGVALGKAAKAAAYVGGFRTVRKIIQGDPTPASQPSATSPTSIPPDFNIVGSTGTNQLAEAIGSTTQQPVKAFVVSSEVSTAQQLDRNRVESASI